MTLRHHLPLLCLLLAPAGLAAQPRPAAQLYAESCASCHGAQLQGGAAPSLLDEVWRFGGRDTDLARVIRDGAPEVGMPAFGEGLSEDEITSLVAYIRAQRTQPPPTATSTPPASKRSPATTSEQHRFVVETLAEGLDEPW